jgi:hypothetical protein
LSALGCELVPVLKCITPLLLSSDSELQTKQNDKISGLESLIAKASDDEQSIAMLRHVWRARQIEHPNNAASEQSSNSSSNQTNNKSQ